MDHQNKWLDEMNKIMGEIGNTRTAVSKIFPENEHLRPLKELSKAMRTKVIDFYKMDLQKLVSFGRLITLEQDALQKAIPTNWTYLIHLRDFIHRSERTRQAILANSKNMTSEIAKKLFSECAESGIIFSEAQLVKEVVRVNLEIEVFMSDQITTREIQKIWKILKDEHSVVDPSAVDAVVKEIQECTSLDAEVKQVLELNKIDFKHLKRIEVLNDKLSATGRFVPQKLQEFHDLFNSFSFCVTLCLERGVKAATLDNALSTLLELLNKMLDQDHVKLTTVLIPIRNIEFSINPIKNFLEHAKILLWRADIKSAFTAAAGIDYQALNSLLSVHPDALRMSDQALKEYQMASEILNHAHKFRKACLEYMSCFDKLFELENPNAIRNALERVTQMYGLISDTYKNQELSLNTELQSCFEKVEKQSPMLVACRLCMKLKDEEHIDIDSFIMLCNMLGRFETDPRKHSTLFSHLISIVKKFQPSLEAINRTIGLMKSGAHFAESDLRTPRIDVLLKKQAQKVKTFDFDFHMQKLGTIVDLGCVGQSFRQRLDEVAQWEKETRTMIEQNQIKDLISFATPAQIELLLDKTLDLKQNFIKSVFYSDALEEVLKYRWSLKAISCFHGSPKSPSVYLSLLSRPVPKVEYIRRLREALKDQLRGYKGIKDSLKEIPTVKPLSSDIKKIKSRLLKLKVRFGPKTTATINEYLTSYRKVKNTLKALMMEPMPTQESIHKMVAKLAAEKITYTEEIEALQTKLEEVQNLATKYRNSDLKPNEKLKIIRRYKELNITSLPFETAIKEVVLDQTVEAEFELALASNLSYAELSLLEDKADTVSDAAWVKNIKERVFLKKSRILESANEGSIDFSLTLNDLHLMFWQVSALHSTSDEVQVKVKKLTELMAKVEEMTKKLMVNPAGSTLAEIERLTKLKRRILNVVDITPQIDSKILKLRRKLEASARRKRKEEEKAAHAQAEERREARDPLAKRRPDAAMHSSKADGVEGVRRKARADDDNEHRDATKQGGRASDRETEARKRTRQLEVPSFLAPKPTEVFAGSNLDSQEPSNSTGTWQLFRGVIKNELPNSSIDEVQLLSVESWNFIRSFPPLPISLTFKAKITKEDVQLSLDNMASENNQKVLPGLVRLEAGVTRAAFSQSFKLLDNNSYHLLEYCRGVYFVLIPAKSFPSGWFNYFSQSELAKNADCDFYFFILNMNKEDYSGSKMNPVVADRLSNKENGAFDFENYREQRQKEKEKKLTRLAPKLNSILATNSSAVNRSRLETSS